LLRISGAIQVLEELLSKAHETTPPPAEAAGVTGESSAGHNGMGARGVVTVP
jgi:hypothetical protein